MPRPSRRRSAPPDTPACRRIRDAAERCFGTLGFQKTSVTEIATVAQVSKPLVYRYFESKEHLYEVVVNDVVEAWNEELVATLCIETGDENTRVITRSASSALADMHRTSLAFASRSSLLRGLLARDGRMMLAAYSDVVERSMTTWREQVEACLAGGVATGEVRGDLPVASLSDAVTELHLAYAERAVAGRDTATDTQRAKDGFACLLDGICTPDAAQPMHNRRPDHG